MAIALLLALAVGAYLYVKLDEEVTRQVRAILSEHYAHLEVDVQNARYVSGTGVLISGLKISQPQPGGGVAPLLEVEELRMLGEFTADSLSTYRPRVDRIELLRPKITATRLPGGRWDIETLFPTPEGGGNAPVRIDHATITVADATNPSAAPLTLRNVSLDMVKTALDPSKGPGACRIDIKGRAEDSLAKLIEFEGGADSDGGRIDVKVDVKQLGLNAERLLVVPMLPKVMLAGLKLSGKLDASTTIKRVSPISPLNWSCSFCLKQAAIAHPLIPKPMTDVEITGDCDPSGVHIKQAKAKSGEAELIGALNTAGWGPQASAACNFSLKRLALGPDIYRALPESHRGAWRRFEPRGEVDINAKLRLSADRVLSDVMVSGRGISVEDKRRFPYRIDSGTGTLRFVDTKTPSESQLTIHLDAQAEGRPVQIDGQFSGLLQQPLGPDDCPVGYFRVTANTARVTERLLTALPDDAERPLRMLRPSGEFGVTWVMRRDSLEQLKPAFSMDLIVRDGAARFKHFPYPVSHITGKVTQRGKQWTFSDFITRGHGGSMVLAGNGSFHEGAERPRLAFRIDGFAAPLDETLRAALPADIQSAWTMLRPNGRIDFNSTVEYFLGDAEPRVDVTVRPHGATVSVRPTAFPYRLENVRGEFVASGNEVRFIQARANHGAASFLADGHFKRQPNGAWRFELKDLSIDRLNVNDDFRAAAPVGLRGVINRLEPEGGLGVHHGSLVLTQNADPSKPLEAEWNLHIDCQQLDINAGAPVNDLFGTVVIQGYSVGDSGVSYGDLQLESMLLGGMQLTNITGPLYCDRHECMLGAGVARKQGGQRRRVTAQAYGGVVELDALALFQNRPRYGIDLTLSAIDLERLSSDFLHSKVTLTGKLDGFMKMQGLGNSIHGLTGSGELVASDADLYELPLLVSMLKVLSNRAPDSTAFDTVDSKFTIQGEHIVFEKLNLLGDAVSLHGRGGANLDRSVDLVFHTLVGKDYFMGPVIRSLAGQASEQLLKLRVTGPIDNAEITREALPLVSNVIQQLRNDLRPAPLTRPAIVPGAAAQRR